MEDSELRKRAQDIADSHYEKQGKMPDAETSRPSGEQMFWEGVFWNRINSIGVKPEDAVKDADEALKAWKERWGKKS